MLDGRRDPMIELARIEKEQAFATQADDNIVKTLEFLETAAQMLQMLTSQDVQLLQTAEMRLSHPVPAAVRNTMGYGQGKVSGYAVAEGCADNEAEEYQKLYDVQLRPS